MAKSTELGDLYRYFDRTGRLLYVGISTRSFTTRLRSHRDMHDWWESIEVVHIEKVPLSVLRDVEAEVITRERPLHNVQHAAGYVKAAEKRAAQRLGRHAPALMSVTVAATTLGEHGPAVVRALIASGDLTVVDLASHRFVYRHEVMWAMGLRV